MGNHQQYRKHCYLVNVISKISERFKLLARDRSLWKGDSINIIGQKSLGFPWTTMSISGSEFSKLAESCPKMETLYLNNMTVNAWPLAFNPPCLSLKKLIIHGCMMDHDLYKNVIMHQSIPNLEQFIWMQDRWSKNAFILPDLSGCHKLKKVILDNGTFTAPSIPFPRSLKMLTRNMASMPAPLMTGFTKASLQAYFDDCDINPNLDFLERPSQTTVHPRERLDTLDKASPTDSVLCRGINTLCGPPTQLPR